ncbi:hypothetical protein [Formosa sp. S-31]|uniref:hypothetical protein n=1 Tax=Formosa sp. S-31 TaxID=2790949 RepID=UPI003EC0861C
MKYTTYNGHQLVAKNKLQEAVQHYLKGIDRILIQDNKALSEFKTNVIANIVFLNIENPRSKAIAAKWMQIDKNDWLLTGVDFCHFTIHHLKKEYHAQ